jgi:hypothetical protein
LLSSCWIDAPPELPDGRALIEATSRILRESCDITRGPWIATYMFVKYTQLASGQLHQGIEVGRITRPLDHAREGEPAMSSRNTLDRKAIAARVLRHLAGAQSRGRLVRLDELASDIGVRREDVRHVVTDLHAEGHVDAKRMKLTMTGLALATAMRECKLRDVREVRAAQVRVA